MNREKECALRKTTHFCYIIKELLHQPSQETSSWQRGKAETSLENGQRKRKSDIKTRGEYSNQLCNVSRRTSDEVDRSKITNRKESNKCDLCKALWVSQGRFTKETALPVQTLGHIQHTCETLSQLHTMTNHRSWLLIHVELSHLASPMCRFICINSEKCFRTLWKELAQEFPEVFNQCVE